MANIDIEKIIGTEEFPTNENDVLGLIETIASQRITAVKSANRLADATFDYDVRNGKVIQEAVIEMAKSYTYDKNAYDRAPEDPTLHVRYFADYTERQFEVTIRRDDVRAIIANKGQGVEDVIAQIISTLTSGEGHEDFENVRALILNPYVTNYASIIGGVPKTIKGAIYAARNMYNHLKSDNSDLTQGAGTEDAYISATPTDDIRVAITEDLLNLMDVVELAQIFNLEKEELFGVLVPIPSSDLPVEDKYKIVVYDFKAMGRATFIYDFTQDEVGKGRFRNEYLTVSRCYFYNELFKAAQIDCTVAANAALTELIDVPFNLAVSVTNGSKTTTPAKILAGAAVEFTVTANDGYTLPAAITVANAIYTYNSTTGEVTVSNAIGDVTVSITCEKQGLSFIPLLETDSFENGKFVLNPELTTADINSILEEISDGQGAVYIFGNGSATPNVSVNGSEGYHEILITNTEDTEIGIYFEGEINRQHIAINGQFFNPAFEESTAFGTFNQASKWNGILFGKYGE